MSAASSSATLPSVPAALVASLDHTHGDLAGRDVVLGAFGLLRHADAFATVLYNTKAALFGGVALTWRKAAYAPITTIVPEGQDIDIFVPVPTISNMPCYPIIPLLRGYYARVLEAAGYHRQTGAERHAEKEERRVRGELEADYTATLPTRIQSVKNFYNPAINRKIQLVFCRTTSVDEFLEHTDLDICRFTVRPYGCNSHDMHIVMPPGCTADSLAAMECGEMRLVNTRASLLASTLSRVSKYYNRGYTLQGSIACTHCGGAEERALTLSEALCYTQRKFLESREAALAAAAAPKVVKKAPVLSEDE